MGPRATLIYLRGKSRVTLLSASHREVINYLSVSYQSAPGATANHKLTLNLTRKHTCTNMYSTYRHTNMHTDLPVFQVTQFAISPALCAQTHLQISIPGYYKHQ